MKSNGKERTKDEDNSSVSILDPPCTQLELAQGHHVAFGITNISSEINA